MIMNNKEKSPKRGVPWAVNNKPIQALRRLRTVRPEDPPEEDKAACSSEGRRVQQVQTSRSRAGGAVNPEPDRVVHVSECQPSTSRQKSLQSVIGNEACSPYNKIEKKCSFMDGESGFFQAQSRMKSKCVTPKQALRVAVHKNILNNLEDLFDDDDLE